VCKSIEGVNGTAGKVLDWVKYVSQVALLPLVALGFWGWWNHEERIDAVALAQQAIATTQEVMNANRFTSGDGLEVWKEISKLKRDIDRKADLIGAEPVREDIRELKERLLRIEDRINR